MYSQHPEDIQALLSLISPNSSTAVVAVQEFLPRKNSNIARTAKHIDMYTTTAPIQQIDTANKEH